MGGEWIVVGVRGEGFHRVLTCGRVGLKGCRMGRRGVGVEGLT